MPDTPIPADDLVRRRDALLAAEPGMRARTLAARLGIGEAALVALRPDAVPLAADWPSIVAGLGALGPVTAITRNEHAVHEKTGTYGTLHTGGSTGLILGEAIDLRIFFGRWRHGFAVAGDGVDARPSLQFFDAHGTAVHKVYATAQTDMAAWLALVEARAGTLPPPVIEPPAAPEAEQPDGAVDVPALRAAWDGLKDTHDFVRLLHTFAVTRLQALRLAGPSRARRLDRSAFPAALEGAAAAALPIMVFVGSPGVIQIHTGPVSRLTRTGPWFNVLDPDFQLHTRDGAIATAWIVRKPTVDGEVTSLELLDAGGGTIAMLFGRRKPGEPEDLRWRALMARIEAREAA